LSLFQTDTSDTCHTTIVPVLNYQPVLHEALWGTGRVDTANLDLVLGGERLALRPVEREPATHWIGSWVEWVNRSGQREEDKNLAPTGTRTPIPRHPGHSQSSVHPISTSSTLHPSPSTSSCCGD
jgi:hypothetical protein